MKSTGFHKVIILKIVNNYKIIKTLKIAKILDKLKNHLLNIIFNKKGNQKKFKLKLKNKK